jgi:hypothetical protein
VKFGTHSIVVVLEVCPPSGVKEIQKNVSGAEYATVLRSFVPPAQLGRQERVHLSQWTDPVSRTFQTLLDILRGTRVDLSSTALREDAWHCTVLRQ